MATYYLGESGPREVRYNSDLDTIELRSFRYVEDVTDESEDGLRRGGRAIKRAVPSGEWTPATKSFIEYEPWWLEEGREKHAAELEAAKKMDDDRPVLCVEVQDGAVFVGGYPVNVPDFLDGDIDKEKIYYGWRVEKPFQTCTEDGMFVSVRNETEGAALRIGFPE